MTRTATASLFADVFPAFWPVLLWNLIQFELDCSWARRQYGEEIIIRARATWWGAIVIEAIFTGDADARWHAPLDAAAARVANKVCDDPEAHLIALNWLVLPRRISAQSATATSPFICDSS